MTVRNPKELLGYLERSRSAIEMALPKHLNPDRMMRLALTCFSTNPAIRKCTPQSILASIVVASQLGLEPGVAGQGYLIPYKETCTFVPGWQGLVGLLNNTGRATAWTGAVYEGDEWNFELGSRPRCQHVPGPNYGDADKLRWVYACGKVNGSEQPVVEAWPMARVWRHRDKFNKVGSRHYSFANEEMYARKVVLLQVLKYMPRSIELNNAIVAADASEMGRGSNVEDGVVIEMPPASPEFNDPDEVKNGLAPAAAPAALKSPAPAPVEVAQSEVTVNRATTPAKSTHEDVSEFLDGAGVSTGDFLGWLESSGRLKDAGSLSTVEEVPETVLLALRRDAKAMAKCVTLYGKKEVTA